MNNEIFEDRKDAGQKLTQLLERYRNADAIVLALPRGGVVIGSVIARKLNLPLGIVVVRKIGHPYNPEFAIGAISESGQTIQSSDDLAKVDENWFKEETERQLNEAKRRREKYWGDKKPIKLKDKIAIIVDDGIATGFTMMAAINEVRYQKPKKIIVAVPVAPPEATVEIKKIVNKFVAVIIPDPFIGSVGSYYEYFPQVSDEEVMELIRQFDK